MSCLILVFTQNLPGFYVHILASRSILQIPGGGNLCLAACYACLGFQISCMKKNMTVDPESVYIMKLSYAKDQICIIAFKLAHVLSFSYCRFPGLHPPWNYI